MKNDKKTLFLTGMVILMPMIVGLLLWNQLPERMATHFSSEGVPNGWSNREFVVFGMPLFLLAMQVLSMGVTIADPKKNNIDEKLKRLIVWFVPIISIFAEFSIYGYSLGIRMNIGTYGAAIVGVAFIIIGNYLPKCRQNYTMGIKLPWTLDDEENWNHTHRMAGYLWVMGGFLMIANVFLKWDWLMFLIVAVMGLVPAIYSYCYYKKYGKKEN